MNSSVMFSSEELNLMSGFLSISSPYVTKLSDSDRICKQSEFAAQVVRILSLEIRSLGPDNIIIKSSYKDLSFLPSSLPDLKSICS